MSNDATNDIATTVTNVLTPIATAELGPLGGLVVQLGVAGAMAAIAKHRQRASVQGLSEAEVQAAARELLAKAPTFEQSVKVGEQAKAGEDDGA